MAQSVDLSATERALEQGDGERALALVQPLLERKPKSAPALLARSTAYFLVGDRAAGERDLERALALDRTLRQGWLNLGALRLADGQGELALEAFQTARALDPQAVENGLNIGAVQLLLGRLDAAAPEFSQYLSVSGDSGEAHLLVAQNYALVGALPLATTHAAAAIDRDERLRLELRTNPAFALALDDPDFQALLARDSYRAKAGSLTVSRDFEVAYELQNPTVVGAVVDALNGLAMPFDPRIEATPSWALIWTEGVRIKVSPGKAPGHSSVQLTAPPRSHSRDQWQALVDRVFDRVEYELAPKIPSAR